MESIPVKHVMVPVSDYATVSKEATLHDAIMALEQAQEAFDQSRYRHRGILVYDENGKIVGKISQTAILRALEPKYEQFEMPRSRYPFSPKYVKSLFSQYDLWNKPLDDICKKASQKRVKEFVESFDESEVVDEEASLNEAIHMLVVGRLQSLLVMREKKVTGILRLTDVFHEVLKLVKACEL
jgi:CBS domain-containing protein